MMVFAFRPGVMLAAISGVVGLCLGHPAAAEEIEGAFSDPSRVISIGGSLTEIVYAMGEEKRLVGRDQTSVYPEAVLSLPDVGYMRQLSPEGVLSLDPTGILLVEGSGPRQTIEVLKKASAELVQVPDRFDRDGIVAKIRAVGRAIGAEEKAEKLAGTINAELMAAERITAGVTQRKRVLFILSAQGGKLVAGGRDTAADGIIKLAGGINVADSFHGYKQFSEEAAIAANPDFVLMMTRGDGSGSVRNELLNHPAIAATPAGKAGAVIEMDGAYILGFGPRTASAARNLAHALYGDLLAN